MNAKTTLLSAIAAGTLMTAGAQADELLLIDLSVTDQITITATGGASSATVSGSNTIGFYFDNFYGTSGSALTAGAGTGDLTAAGTSSDGSPSLFRATGGADTGLNVWSFATVSTVSFTSGSTAFTGSATWSLTATEYADMLAGNTTGDIYFAADDIGDLAGASVIGTYRVVPAPAGAAVLGLGGLVATRRRRA